MIICLRGHLLTWPSACVTIYLRNHLLACVRVAICLCDHLLAWLFACVTICLRGHLLAWQSACVTICLRAICLRDHLLAWPSACVTICLCDHLPFSFGQCTRCTWVLSFLLVVDPLLGCLSLLEIDLAALQGDQAEYRPRSAGTVSNLL